MPTQFGLQSSSHLSPTSAVGVAFHASGAAQQSQVSAADFGASAMPVSAALFVASSIPGQLPGNFPVLFHDGPTAMVGGAAQSPLWFGQPQAMTSPAMATRAPVALAMTEAPPVLPRASAPAARPPVAVSVQPVAGGHSAAVQPSLAQAPRERVTTPWGVYTSAFPQQASTPAVAASPVPVDETTCSQELCTALMDCLSKCCSGTSSSSSDDSCCTASDSSGECCNDCDNCCD